MALHRGWLAFLGLSALLAGAMAACGSDEEAPPGGSDAGDENTAIPVPAEGGVIRDGGVTTSACADASPDADIDCTGKCGPVTDLCTGVVKECGGCANAERDGGGDGGPQACDLATNTCGVPKRSCKELGAECGTVKNSCGDYLDCPDTLPKGCGAGKECDPDTHKCRECQAVTCKDLGYECGSVWLGCGLDTPANYTDCGTCAPDANGPRRCNRLFHTCEPSCRPKGAAEICRDAKAKKGVECGVVSDGCGLTVNCDTISGFGCKNGESCGVRGIANRCDPKTTPDECKAAGRTCGEVISACTGQKVKCGNCPTGEVCNANGICGAPCTPKTCTDFAAFDCGAFDDGCKGTLRCDRCPSGSVCNNRTRTCCATSICNGTYPGKCGQDLANGCGQNSLDCNCGGGTVCTVDGGAAPPPATSRTGTCCTPRTPASYAGQCGVNLPNGCGGTLTVPCPGNGICVATADGSPGAAPPEGVAGTCCTPTHTCAGQPADQCNPVQNSCRPAGTLLNCDGNCNAGAPRCQNGTCCAPAADCSGNGGENAECNVVHPGNGCGSDRTCDCNGGRTCWCGDHECVPGVDGAGTCRRPLNCNSPQYAGHCGIALDNGIGNTIDCTCTTGRVCTANTPGALGDCPCANGTGAPYTCANVPNGPGQPGGDKCGTFDDGCGGTVPCGCTGGQTCNTAANPNVCCTALKCPAKALGSICGTAIANNCGGTIACSCPSGTGNENFDCAGGVCVCVKDTCRGRTGPQPDRCGGTLQCGG